MYNEFGIKHYKGKWPCTAKTLYSEKTLIGRLQQYFLIYFETFSVPLGYRMWQKKESKLELAASMIRQVMPEFQEKKQVIKGLKTADSSISLFFIFIPLILFRVNVNSLYPIHVLNAMRIVNSRKLWYNQVIMVSISIQNIKGEKKYERAWKSNDENIRQAADC